jgi:hypothetical protein
MSQQLFTQLMKDEDIKKAVLVEFGFGNVNKLKVNKWVKEQFPVQYAEIKKNIPSKKVVEFASNETEMTTREERDVFLDRVIGKLDSMLERKVVQVYEDDLEQLIDKYQEAEYNRDGLSMLIFDFLIENGLSNEFFEYMRKYQNREGYPTDIDQIMLDYIPKK